jgi:hypothetical protein
MSSVAEDKESVLNFQKQCEGDVKSLRNLTLDVINSIKGLKDLINFVVFNIWLTGVNFMYKMLTQVGQKILEISLSNLGVGRPPTFFAT